MVLQFFRKLVSSRPVLFIVIYDEQTLTFSRPHPSAVQKHVNEQPVWWGARTRVRALLAPASDKVTRIRSIVPFHSELRDDVGREYIFVAGSNFSFKNRLGRDFFDPKTDDLVLKFGEPDGQIVSAMIDYCMPKVVAKAA